ncbi:copper chaperone PCu(A)C [Poseidonibacter lekithochrous]|uniref:copper chaperone PCu(A)C n=1 Tax=Poseidonibacter lekithochrous TaxID=1904463 RepID=UPI0008FC3C80|nr:copper chaperone PCu(A)C [Poseidonibacter lekithochrous]QKJ21983.1 copper chaperone PCu(A)C [Poseidonibacter lekithochrous]
MKLKSLLLLIASASTIYASSITVKNAYVRATPPSLPNSAAFMELHNSSDKDISVMSASSDASKVAELHTHDMKDGVMMMYQVPKIDIKANSSTTLKPGGFHVMLLGLKTKPLKEEMNVEINLNLSNGQTLKVFAPVKKVMAGMKMGHGMNKKSSGMSCGAGKCGSK